MRGPRRKAREAALKILYQMESRGQEALAGEERSLAALRDRAYAEELVQACREGRAELDRVITAASKNWAFSRIPLLDRNILRIGIHEILHSGEVPRRVAIDEAVRLAKRYGDKKSYAFVNGILDSVKRKGSEEEEE